MNHESFAEIEINAADTASNAISIPQPQRIRPAKDEKRALFHSMRRIATNNFYSYMEIPKIFHQQALFMKNFEDDYTGQEPFSAYYPDYQKMGHEQLRTYFTWRTKVRKGIVTKTHVSYAFLYIYELLNNIGVTDPKDGFDKLISFWRTYRSFNLVIDRYVLHWIKDYHIYYPLPHTFHEFVKSNRLQLNYPTVFGYGSGRQDSFDLFTGISGYNIKKSTFYCEHTHEMIRECFYFMLTRLRDLCKGKNKCFEDFIFYPIKKENTWTPFSSALFYPSFEQADRRVILSEKEIYSCRQNHWVHTTVIMSDQGKKLLGCIMKEMEANLRNAFNFKHKFRSNVDLHDNKAIKQLEQMKIFLPLEIKKSVEDFYKLYNRKEVTVDLSNLMKIREEAQNIQEKLIVPEDADMLEKEAISDGDASPMTVSDIWAGFLSELTQMEFETLTIILHNNDIKNFAREKGIMLEVLLDGINQKAMDYIGDTVLCFEDTVSIYDDYIEKLTELLK